MARASPARIAAPSAVRHVAVQGEQISQRGASAFRRAPEKEHAGDEASD
jgi:hypothetical protein